MPKFSKKVLSQRLRTQCDRQLRLNLYTDSERKERGMPEEMKRAGIYLLKQEGDRWQAKVFKDLSEAFGPESIVGEQKSKSDRKYEHEYEHTALEDLIESAAAGRFIVEAKYPITQVFKTAVGAEEIEEPGTGEPLTFSAVVPDIIEVFAPRRDSEIELGGEVTPFGEIEPIPEEDDRVRLRIIDVKLTSEPSPSYFAEIAYYSMTLASWLKAKGLDERFVVVEDAAIWPGAHPGSHLRKKLQAWHEDGYADPSIEAIRAVMDKDLEEIPFDVFAPRVRRIIEKEVPAVLEEENWRCHNWHVGLHCQGCDFLGNVWGDAEPDPLHCAPMADEEDDLSQIAEISRGSSDMLRKHRINDINDLAATDPMASENNRIFNAHQELRARRAVMPERAKSLVEAKKSGSLSEEMKVVPWSGTSVIMPRRANLRIHLFVEFDLSSAISFSFGAKAFWNRPKPYDKNVEEESVWERWAPTIFPVHIRDLQREQSEFLAFLKHLRSILEYVQAQDEKAAEDGPERSKSSVQFYLWDSAQKKHLTRVVGRHLDAILADEDLREVAWLFPADEMVANPRDARHSSPITVVSDAVNSHLALPVPHAYTLMEVVDAYNDMDEPEEGEDDYVPHLMDYYKDPLSSLIPSERGHEMWSQEPRDAPFPGWFEVAKNIENAGRKKLNALESVANRLRKDLDETLSYKSAPTIKIGPPGRLNAASWDAQLWNAFARLNAALEEVETQQVRALPSYEREARFKSARLEERLVGQEREEALETINDKQGKDLNSETTGRYVYRMRDGSEDVGFKEGDFTVAISSEHNPDHSGMLDRKMTRVMGTSNVLTRKYRKENRESGIWNWYFGTMAEVLRVKIEAIDRENRTIVVRSTKYPEIIADLEGEGVTDLSADAVLDPTSQDFFCSKLKKSLKAIGDPEIAGDNSNVRRAVGQQDRSSRTSSDFTPAAGFLWEPEKRYTSQEDFDVDWALEALAGAGYSLNDSQQEAFKSALTRRLSLIWGPPGTGKSRTLRAIIKGAVLEAVRKGEPLRLLVTAFTYRALDEVLLEVSEELDDVVSGDDYFLARVRSKYRGEEKVVADSPAADIELNKRDPSGAVRELRARLKENDGISIVGATPEQTHNLMQVADEAQEELFDLVLLDEASQMDVAHAILPLCAMSEGASLVIAGDDKQLDPIHKAEPPERLENMVGSIYNFFSKHHGVPHSALRQNYRSSEEIVGFVRKAGYDESLESYSKNLKLRFIGGLPDDKPDRWPRRLKWQPGWKRLLDPERPVGCFLYEDEMSGQSNPFEADSVASLIWLLRHSRMADEPENLRGEDGNIRPVSNAPYDEESFWQEGVGVVTPHKAQMGRIITSLREAFPDTSPALLRGAVDTVERFQGQERDVIIGSFGLGDPDAIRDEDEFLYSLNRFNVMASRARAKLLVFATRSVVDHLPTEVDTLRESRLLKAFADAYCNQKEDMTLSYLTSAEDTEFREGVFKYRER